MAVLGLSVLNIGLSFFFKETTKETRAFDTGQLRQELTRSINIRQLWQRLQEFDQARPGLTPITLLTLLLTLNQGYLNYFISYVGLGQLKMDATQISYFFAFLGGLCALSNFLYFKHLVNRLNKRWVLIGAFWIGVALHLTYANVHSSLLLLYIAAAAEALSASLIAGLLNGLLAQLSDEQSRGSFLGLRRPWLGSPAWLPRCPTAACL